MSTNSSEINKWFTSKGKPPVLWLLILWLLACSLALTGLGELPLRDFDEGTVARVALEISNKSGIERLLPTIWGSPYLNKPPGLHLLIALAIQINRYLNPHTITQLPSETVIRIVPAILSTLVVPLGGLIQWKLRPNDRLAIKVYSIKYVIYKI